MDKVFHGFGTMATALDAAGLLRTTKGTARKMVSPRYKCRGRCGGYTEFLSPFKKFGYCIKCGEELRSYRAFRYLRQVGGAR